MIAPLRILLAALAIPLACLLATPALAAIPQFNDNGDGTITDNYTGLMWDKCSWGQSGTTCATGAASTHTWQQALAVATTANTGSHKTYTDWRLPNKNELESIVNLGVSNPAIDTEAFPNTPSNWFWSSTTYAPVPADAWFVHFGNGSAYADLKAGTVRVRLVRSGQSFGPFDSLAVPMTSYTATTATASGSATASFTGGGAGCGFTVSQFIPVSGVATPPPAGLTFPQGLFDFTAGGCTAGGTVSFTVTYPSALPAGAQYWKYGPTTTDPSYHWYVLPATIVGNTATFSITDGGLGDDDLTANGTIVDQGGPGVPGGAGVAGVAGIPTLSEWGMILLSSLLAGMGLLGMRRRGML